MLSTFEIKNCSKGNLFSYDRKMLIREMSSKDFVNSLNLYKVRFFWFIKYLV